ncbi:MAG: DUF1292 domain-containing protein [Lachnospiraceae bacterium]|nr:DUF1292 domain-containing protein [Lachnospiraceae bacterium]
MEKLIFDTDEGTEEFYIIEQTRVNGKSYILVTKEEDAEDPEVIILRDDSQDTDKESLYVAVEDDDELEAIAKVFEVLLDEEDTEAE